jgi:hypothetical protein
MVGTSAGLVLKPFPRFVLGDNFGSRVIAPTIIRMMDHKCLWSQCGDCWATNECWARVLYLGIGLKWSRREDATPGWRSGHLVCLKNKRLRIRIPAKICARPLYSEHDHDRLQSHFSSSHFISLWSRIRRHQSYICTDRYAGCARQMRLLIADWKIISQLYPKPIVEYSLNKCAQTS